MIGAACDLSDRELPAHWLPALDLWAGYGDCLDLRKLLRDYARHHRQDSLGCPFVQHAALVATGSLREEDSLFTVFTRPIERIQRALGGDTDSIILRLSQELSIKMMPLRFTEKLTASAAELCRLADLVQAGWRRLRRDDPKAIDWLVERHGNQVGIQVKHKEERASLAYALSWTLQGLCLGPGGSWIRGFLWSVSAPEGKKTGERLQAAYAFSRAVDAFGSLVQDGSVRELKVGAPRSLGGNGAEFTYWGRGTSTLSVPLDGATRVTATLRQSDTAAHLFIDADHSFTPRPADVRGAADVLGRKLQKEVKAWRLGSIPVVVILDWEVPDDQTDAVDERAMEDILLALEEVSQNHPIAIVAHGFFLSQPDHWFMNKKAQELLGDVQIARNP